MQKHPLIPTSYLGQSNSWGFVGSQDLEREEGEDKGGSSPLFTGQLYSDWNGQLRDGASENFENMVDTGKELNSLGFVRSSEERWSLRHSIDQFLSESNVIRNIIIISLFLRFAWNGGRWLERRREWIFTGWTPFREITGSGKFGGFMSSTSP